jgi:hypothetical protein
LGEVDRSAAANSAVDFDSPKSATETQVADSFVFVLAPEDEIDVQE